MRRKLIPANSRPAAERIALISTPTSNPFRAKLFAVSRSEPSQRRLPPRQRRLGLARGGDNGFPAIRFGDSAHSPLILYAAQLDPDTAITTAGQEASRSPPPRFSLLRAWIDQGAWGEKRPRTRSEIVIAGGRLHRRER